MGRQRLGKLEGVPLSRHTTQDWAAASLGGAANSKDRAKGSGRSFLITMFANLGVLREFVASPWRWHHFLKGLIKGSSRNVRVTCKGIIKNQGQQ
jgi:hypothetical protein